MQVGISTASLFNRYEVEDTPAQMAALGASLCELFLNTFSEYEEEFISLLKSRLEASKLCAYSVHPMGTQFEPQLFSVHHRQREDANKLFEKVLRAGQALGARCYVMHGPSGLNGAVKNMELSRIGPIVQELCKRAASHGLTLAWENVSWCLFSEPRFGPALLEATGADDLRFTLDIKQAVRSGYAPVEYIRAVGDRLINLHLCDYRHVGGRVVPAMPGRGECDFPELGRALAEKGYRGPAFLEVYSDMYETQQQLLESYRFVSGCLEK